MLRWKNAILLCLVIAVGILLIRGQIGADSTPPPAESESIPGESPGAEKPEDSSQKLGDGFVRFIPDDQGDIIWELKGTTAQFISLARIEIMNLVATSFDQELGPLTIQVDRVFYNPDTREADSRDERVNVRRGNSVLTGRGIVWIPAQSRIRVIEDVRVLINEENQGGLFPL
jgi:hypothetical protein